MIQHHPDPSYLSDYAAGAMPTAFAAGVRAHLHLCAQCQQHVRELTELGACAFEQQATTQTAASLDELYADIVAQIDAAPSGGNSDNNSTTANNSVQTKNCTAQDGLPCSDIPPVLEKLLHKPLQAHKWQTLSPSLKRLPLAPGDNQEMINFYRIKPGGKIAAHDHRGDELTLVLRGSFSDQNGVYQRGDFILRRDGEPHRPMASQDEECLCFSVEQSMPRFTGPFGRILNFALG